MFVLGLTGSIGMGKSTTAALFRARGVPVYDADAAVHALYRSEAAPLIEAAFPGVVQDGVVNRQLLAAKLNGQPEAFEQLEAIVHPLVRRSEATFLTQAQAARASLVVLDIPLLFETGGAARVDAVLVVTAPAEVQHARVMARPGMTAEKFSALKARQMPDVEKRRHAHFTVDTSLGLPHAERSVRDIIRALAGLSGRRAMFDA
jgi:dephospho-CoA kinase